MTAHEISKKLQDIIRGNVLEGQQDPCTTIRNLLCRSFETGPTLKSQFESRAVIKEEQGQYLRSYAQNAGILFSAVPPGARYLTKGGEAQIYYAPDSRKVIKLNDAIYYATWTEYFNSIVIHNLLFPNTAYTVAGFIEMNKSLHAVMQQQFIQGEQAGLDDIKDLLTFNGFENTRRQDYFHKEFGLILEDMHDENVIAKDDVLFFIDTVFYITAPSIQ